MNTSHYKNLYILAFALVVVMLGFGLVIPIMPFYIEHMGAGGTELGLLVASYAVMRLIFGPIWGSISDRFGRKPVLMIGMLGYAITMFWFGLATELWMLFVARSLSGILSSATGPTTMAFVSDNTVEKERSRGMGILGAAIGIGTIIGPAVGGWLAGDASDAAALVRPFFIAGGMSLISLLLIALLVPESLPARASKTAKAPASAPAHPRVSAPLVWQTIRSPVGMLLLIALLASFAMTAFFGIFGLYALERFDYGPQQVGLVMMIMGLMSAIAQGLLLGPTAERWGEATVIKASLLLSIFGFLGIVFAASIPAVLLVTALFSLAAALLGTAATSLTSQFSHLEQGLTMGLNHAAGSLGRIFGPLISGFLFDMHIAYPFLFGAVVMLAGFIISLSQIQQKKPQAVQALPM
jgi:DHA1 family multidrug resistance protein-like MFS transporter